METEIKVRGRPFQKGNPGGPGRPRREHEARYQKRVYQALTEEAVYMAASKLVELAEQGDVAAIREILRLVLPRVPDPFETIGEDDAPLPEQK